MRCTVQTCGSGSGLRISVRGRLLEPAALMSDPGPAAAPRAAAQRAGRRRPGWKVQPAPDGRGAPPAPRPPLMPKQRRGRWVAFIAGLLLFNLVFSFVTARPEERTRIPYEPFFVDQVRAGNVQQISSQRGDDPGRAQEAGELHAARRQGGPGRQVRHAGAGVRGDPGAHAAARREQRRHERRDSGHGRSVPGHAAARLRPDDPARRALHLALPPAPEARAARSGSSGARKPGA